jgi:hypothetical protein
MVCTEWVHFNCGKGMKHLHGLRRGRERLNKYCGHVSRDNSLSRPYRAKVYLGLLPRAALRLPWAIIFRAFSPPERLPRLRLLMTRSSFQRRSAAIQRVSRRDLHLWTLSVLWPSRGLRRGFLVRLEVAFREFR